MATIAFTLLFDDKYNEEQLNRALACLDQALELEPENAWALSIKGGTLCDLAEYAESIQAFNQSAQLDPDDVNSRTYLGWALQCQGTTLMEKLWEQQVEKGFLEKVSLKDWASRARRKCRCRKLKRPIVPLWK